MDTTRAVFLSYASEDAEAAERLATVLRAGGVEVWFDRSELRGGDAWDRQIRKQIHDCALFMPVISAHSQARLEGYFRREWKLAADRTHDMAEEKAFLVPVVIDNTSERVASVPDKFRDVQWTHLPAGETTAAFIERVRGLLSPETAPAPERAHSAGGAVAGVSPGRGDRVARRTPTRWRTRFPYITGVVAALALGYFALERLTGLKSHAQGSPSIAVLPLTNESGDSSQQYFSDGISEDLINALSQFQGLKVIGRTSSFQFRDSREDSRSIGSKLGVAHLLEGSVRRAGDVVRVSAELIDATDGSTQWTERYDRPYKDLFALQDEITRAVTAALRTKLLPGEHAAKQSERPPGGSLEAYNALLQGRFYSARHTEADLRNAIESFAQATRLDPRYALAWSEQATAWTTLSAGFLEGVSAQEAYGKARAAADLALTVSPELAAAHLARGYLSFFGEFDWRGAEIEYRRAMDLAPSDADTKFFLGSQLAAFGELEPAVELTRQALVTEPLQAAWYNYLALYLSGLNRLDEAERTVRRAIELQPNGAWFHQTLAVIEIKRGNAQAALVAAGLEPAGVWQDSALGLARQINGDRDAADAALRTLIDKDANISAYQIAEGYALRDDAKLTFEWLDRAWRNRDSGIGFLLYDPFILRYKNDPRFAAFCRKVGLPTPEAVDKRT